MLLSSLKYGLLIFQLLQLYFKDIPTGDSLFGDVPTDLFDQIPGTLSVSEERKHKKLLSKTRNVNFDMLSPRRGSRSRDRSPHQANQKEGKGMCFIVNNPS